MERTVETVASPDAVWAVLVGVERWPEWTAPMTRLTEEYVGMEAQGLKRRCESR